ncbi:hypothetical protein KKD95_02280 [Patescibacteria group bacterium]|nr:hypothetical protein [Patescibacteria group bacterium]
MNNKQNTIADKVLERVEQLQLKPRSRQFFKLRNIGIWFLAALSVVVGGLAISSIIFRSVNAGAALRPGTPPLQEALLVMPFLWIILMVIFVYVAYREIRSTKRGYKYSLTALILGTLLASSVLGIVFYTAGAGFMLDRFAARHVPFHADLEGIQRERWQHPADGFLAGTVGAQTETGIRLMDSENQEWQVTFSDTIPEKRLQLTEGERVGLRGTLIDAQARTFLACDVRSLEFEGRGLQPPRPPQMRIERKDLPPRSNRCEDVRPLN